MPLKKFTLGCTVNNKRVSLTRTRITAKGDLAARTVYSSMSESFLLTLLYWAPIKPFRPGDCCAVTPERAKFNSEIANLPLLKGRSVAIKASSDIEMGFVIHVERRSMAIDRLSNFTEQRVALRRRHHPVVRLRP